jgi:hypothetical protein
MEFQSMLLQLREGKRFRRSDWTDQHVELGAPVSDARGSTYLYLVTPGGTEPWFPDLGENSAATWVEV